MLTFTQLGCHGRLGNQLYQYAALKSAALKHNYECKIPNPKHMNWHGQNCLLNNFNLDTTYLTEQDIKTIKNRVYINEPITGVYNNALEKLEDNTDICGFFQNTKYFEQYSKEIKRELTPKKEYLEKGQRRLDKLRRKNKSFVSLHIRRGDQTDGTNAEYLKYYGISPFDTNCVVGNYIVQTLSFFSECDVLIFTGGSRSGNDTNDIKWAKNYFSDDKFIVSETNDVMQDFVLISLCENNIVTHASSFGWWAAYINPNPNKIVYAPLDHHFDQKYNLKEGFYPKDWKLI